ncbi:MAG: hypothetical protein OFPII_40520 [Osedax symbiont Rs1]|nr:MAG: hypothetical protein OFPII_40520 [Osedax symbiont Rs1]
MNLKNTVNNPSSKPKLSLLAFALNQQRYKINFTSFNALLALLLALLIMTITFALSTGRYDIEFIKVIKILASHVIDLANDWKIVEQKVVELVRLPRILVAALCGAALSLCGAALQGLFRNPLVGPQIIGVSSGAAFGGVMAILLMLTDYWISLFSFGFGSLALLLTLGISRSGGGSNILSLVLGGIVTSAFFASLIALVKYTADPDDTLPTIVYWLMGSFNESSYTDVLYVLIPLLTAGVLVIRMRFIINILSLGEEEAHSLGVNVDRSRWMILLSITLMIAATVSVSGIVGWVGLIVPHFARMITGANHARLLPVSMFIGSIYMVLVDTVARTASYGEIPIGVLTALLGAPIFAWLLYRTQLRGWSND